MGIQLMDIQLVEHVMVGNGYTTWCRTCNGG